MSSAELQGMRELNRALDKAATYLVRETKKVVKKTGVEVKRDAVKRVRAGLSAAGRVKKSHLYHYPRTISFDILDDGMTAEIGPDKGMTQGARGRGVEFGSSKAGPIPHMVPAADAQDPLFRAHLKAVADGAI